VRIAWISSWPPRHCGIATYSMELVQALREKGNEIHIVCHTDGGGPGERNVYPVIDTNEIGWDEKVYETVKTIKPDLVHIQHEYGLYQMHSDYASGLFRPLFRWRVEKSFPVVVTYHSVYTLLNPMIRCYMDLMQKIVDAGIVHAEYQWAHIPVNVGRVFDNVYIIPHGAKSDVAISKEEAKESQSLAGKKIVGMIGWFTPTKAFHRVINIWDDLAMHLDQDTVLVLAGDARMGDPGQIDYKNKLLASVDKCKSKDRIKLLLGSFSPFEYDRILGCFDVMVMPYTFASQSGNLAHSFALGVPVIVSNLEGLKAEVEASGAGVTVPPGDDEELKRAILTMMGDDTLRNKYAQKALTYVKNRIGWPITAEKHLRLYRKVIKEKKKEEKDIRFESMLES